MPSSILTVPHPALRTPANAITNFQSAKTQQALDNLADTLEKASNPEGVGLAFPQIGESLRGFATYLDHKLTLYLNPTLLDRDDTLTLGGSSPDRPTLEGCLSIPWLYGPVPRPKKIKIEAFDRHGLPFTKTLSSFRARVFLHELDHLDGILFTDYTVKQNLPLYLLDRQTQEFKPLTNLSTVIKW